LSVNLKHVSSIGPIPEDLANLDLAELNLGGNKLEGALLDLEI